MRERVLLTLGHGYCAAALAEQLRWEPADWRILGTTRSPENAERMAETGIEPILWQDRAAMEDAIAIADHVLCSIPPERDGSDPALNAYGGALSRRKPHWVGYFSTTGVYGDQKGGWVDEASALIGAGDRSQRRIRAEAAWRGADLGVSIFRLPGIYGPGRSVLDRVRAGTAKRIVKPGQVFCRIHRDDVAQTLRAAMAANTSDRAFNVVDDEPAPLGDVIAFAAELLGLPIPPKIPYEEVQMSPIARSFYDASKRVKNDRIKQELQIKLAYPTYREGLRAILAAGG